MEKGLDWSALVPSQAVAVTLTTPHPSPWLLLLTPGLVVGKGCAFGCCWMHPLLFSGAQVDGAPNSHHAKM